METQEKQISLEGQLRVWGEKDREMYEVYEGALSYGGRVLDLPIFGKGVVTAIDELSESRELKFKFYSRSEIQGIKVTTLRYSDINGLVEEYVKNNPGENTLDYHILNHLLIRRGL